MWDLVPWPVIEPRPPVGSAESEPLDHQGSAPPLQIFTDPVSESYHQAHIVGETFPTMNWDHIGLHQWRAGECLPILSGWGGTGGSRDRGLIYNCPHSDDYGVESTLQRHRREGLWLEVCRLWLRDGRHPFLHKEGGFQLCSSSFLSLSLRKELYFILWLECSLQSSPLGWALLMMFPKHQSSSVYENSIRLQVARRGPSLPRNARAGSASSSSHMSPSVFLSFSHPKLPPPGEWAFISGGGVK